MKTYSKPWLATAVLVFTAFSIITLIFRTVHAAGPWYVAPGGMDTNSCLSAISPCATINGAIEKASSGDTIYVAVGTYTASTGDEVVLIDRNITLSGGWNSDFTLQNGMFTIDGQSARRGMNVEGMTAIVTHIIVQNGTSAEYGGGIYNNGGTLALSSSTVISNTSSNHTGGGGIYNYNGHLIINNSAVLNNTANDCDGDGGGGIMSNHGDISLTGSTVSNNAAGGTGNGGGIFLGYGSTMTLTNTIVSDNVASTEGGGIMLARGSANIATINQSIVSGNTAGYGGGGINMSGGVLTLTNSTLSNNISDYPGGGGINMVDAILTAINSTLSNNSTIEFGNGGGIRQEGGILTLSNSTVSNNASWHGGGIFKSTGTANLNNTTVSKNRASSDSSDPVGGGGVLNSSYYGTSLTVRNSIIAGNSNSTSPDCFGTIDSAGYNIIGNNAGCTFTTTTGDKTNVSALLFPLIGSPGYHTMPFNSPAVNAGNPSGCTDNLGNLLVTDQRGVSRVGRCDMGSYEYDPASDPLTYTFMPMIAKPKPPRGLYGTVKENWVLAANVPLILRFYNGSSWSTVANTTTTAAGVYSFTTMPALGPNQLYYVRYQNTLDGNPNRLWAWGTQEVSTYAPGSEFNIGNFDLANIELVSPSPGATVSLPYTFQWARRPASPTDNYEFNLFDYDDGDPYFSTVPPLGYVGSFTLNNLPPGFNPNVPYTWDIWAYSPDGGFGISYWSYYVSFSNTGLAFIESGQPALLEHKPLVEDLPTK